jgi:excisionase family DNA binding protein
VLSAAVVAAMTSGDRPVLLSPDDVAAQLGVRRDHVYRLLARGWLPTVHVGRLLRIPATAVAAFIASGGKRP